MKKLALLVLTVIVAATLVVGCGSTARETGSSGSYYNNPTSSK